MPTVPWLEGWCLVQFYFQIHPKPLSIPAGHQRLTQRTQRDDDHCKWHDDVIVVWRHTRDVTEMRNLKRLPFLDLTLRQLMKLLFRSNLKSHFLAPFQVSHQFFSVDLKRLFDWMSNFKLQSRKNFWSRNFLAFLQPQVKIHSANLLQNIATNIFWAFSAFFSQLVFNWIA